MQNQGEKSIKGPTLGKEFFHFPKNYVFGVKKKKDI